jgi:hypothetical protein
MKRAKIIVVLVAILTAGSLFALKGKMMHHRKGMIENCHNLKAEDGDKKFQDHHKHFKFEKKKRTN